MRRYLDAAMKWLSDHLSWLQSLGGGYFWRVGDKVIFVGALLIYDKVFA